MPGEPKPQVPSRSESYSNLDDSVDSNSQPDESELAPWEMVDVSNWKSISHSIKRELTDSEDEMEDRRSTPHNFDMTDADCVLPEPMNIKQEDMDEDWMDTTTKNDIKDFPEDQKTHINRESCQSRVESDSTDTDSVRRPIVPDLSNVKQEPKEQKISTYTQLYILHNSMKNSIKKTPDVEVKTEIVDSFPETSNTAEAVEVKAEDTLLTSAAVSDKDQENSLNFETTEVKATIKTECFNEGKLLHINDLR